MCAAAAAAALAAGCGFGPGSARPGAVTLTVTRGFGEHPIASTQVNAVRPSDTVIRLLESHTRVTTAYGGGYVQSINGLAGSKTAERDWFFYVNGSQPSIGAADVTVHPGDRIQWDYHRWDATIQVPAIVGAFPKPFTGRGAVLECAAPSSTCSLAGQRLRAAGVTVSSARAGQAAPAGSVAFVVGPWSAIARLSPALAIQRGPAVGGVFAHFDPRGGRPTLLDGGGHPAGMAPDGTGFVAATVDSSGRTWWVVTGADDAGVARAAGAVTTSVLHDKFAVAVEPSGPVGLPVGG